MLCAVPPLTGASCGAALIPSSYNDSCVNGLVDDIRSQSARGAALGIFAVIVMGCVASGVGGLRAPFVLIVHFGVVLDHTVETFYSGYVLRLL